MDRNALHEWRKPITARSLALWSLSTAAPDPVHAARLMARSALFGIEPAAMRVALGRLLRDRMAVWQSRGVYALGPAATAIHVKARGWADTERLVRSWAGEWLIALVDHLGRTDRRRVQARERALRLTGFAASSTGAWVRPDNLVCDLERLASDLHGMGLDEGTTIFAGCEVRSVDAATWTGLWSRRVIEDGYHYWLGELERSAKRLPSLPAPVAARETFLLGQSVIRTINSDPLLPREMIDVTLRVAMIDTMKAYDATARRVWRSMDSEEALPASDTMEALLA